MATSITYKTLIHCTVTTLVRAINPKIKWSISQWKISYFCAKPGWPCTPKV